MRRSIKEQKQKPILMVDPPPYDESVESIGNRLHQRRNIIDELDLIKARVNQVASYASCVHIRCIKLQQLLYAYYTYHIDNARF